MPPDADAASRSLLDSRSSISLARADPNSRPSSSTRRRSSILSPSYLAALSSSSSSFAILRALSFSFCASSTTLFVLFMSSILFVDSDCAFLSDSTSSASSAFLRSSLPTTSRYANVDVDVVDPPLPPPSSMPAHAATAALASPPLLSSASCDSSAIFSLVRLDIVMLTTSPSAASLSDSTSADNSDTLSSYPPFSSFRYFRSSTASSICSCSRRCSASRESCAARSEDSLSPDSADDSACAIIEWRRLEMV